MLGLDLDGTLLGPAGELPPAHAEAVERALGAGIEVVICTGRAWRESRRVLERLPGVARGVFVTGAAVCRCRDGHGLDLAVIEPHLAHRLVEHLCTAPEAVLIFQEAAECGYDYLVTGRGELTGNTAWWFEHTGARVRFEETVTEDDLHHTLRVGVVARPERARALEVSLQTRFGEEVFCHHFEAVTGTHDTEPVHVLEIFAAGVDKWRGLSVLCEAHRIQPEEVAVIGDSINDLAMIKAAGCGIAMANAGESVRRAADRHTRSHEADGVAYAVDQLLSGAW